MPNPKNDAVIAIVENLKAVHSTLSAVMSDLAALRATILQSPQMIVAYEENLKAEVAKVTPLIEGAMLGYDAIIQQLKSSSWSN